MLNQTQVIVGNGKTRYHHDFNEIRMVPTTTRIFFIDRDIMPNQEPNDSMPKIVPEKDDLQSFHHRQQRTPSVNTNRDISEKSTNMSSSFWPTLIIVFTIAFCGAFYWLFSQYQNQNIVLLEAQRRITELEQRLSTTGEEMDQSAVALQVKVSELSKKTQELWEQMDKLWASAWRRNQLEIKALSEKAKQDNLKSVQQTTGLEKELNATTINLEALKEQLDIQQASANQLSEAIAKTNTTSQDSQKKIRDLNEKLSAAIKENERLVDKINTLESWQRKARIQIEANSQKSL